MKNPALYYVHLERPAEVSAALKAIADLDPLASCELLFDSAIAVSSLVGVREFEGHLRGTLECSFVLATASRLTVTEWHPL